MKKELPQNRFLSFTTEDKKLSKEFAESLSDERLAELANNPSPARYNELAIEWALKNGHKEWAEKLKSAVTLSQNHKQDAEAMTEEELREEFGGAAVGLQLRRGYQNQNTNNQLIGFIGKVIKWIAALLILTVKAIILLVIIFLPPALVVMAINGATGKKLNIYSKLLVIVLTICYWIFMEKTKVGKKVLEKIDGIVNS